MREREPEIDWREMARRSSGRRRETGNQVPQLKSQQSEVVSSPEEDTCGELVARLLELSPVTHLLLLNHLRGDTQRLCRLLRELRDDQATAAEHLQAGHVFAVRNLAMRFLDQQQNQQ